MAQLRESGDLDQAVMLAGLLVSLLAWSQLGQTTDLLSLVVGTICSLITNPKLELMAFYLHGLASLHYRRVLEHYF